MNNYIDNHKNIKTIIILTMSIIVLIICASCGGKDEEEQQSLNRSATPAANVEENGDGEDSHLALFRTTVKQAKEAGEIVSFLNENLAKAGKHNADIMVREMIAYYNADLEHSQEAFFQPKVQEILVTLPWPITSANAAAIQDDVTRQLVVSKLSGGYKLVHIEGSIYPIVDYEMMKKMTRAYLSDSLNDYITLLAVESNEESANDGGLIIPWDELATRAVMAESYIELYPDSPDREVVEGIYLDRYLPMYIYGLNNTPVFDYDTFKLLEEVRASYEKLVSEQPDTVTARIVKSFLDVLEGTDGRVFTKVNGQQTDIAEVRHFHNSFRSEAGSMLNQQ